jgi:hypothetical protein
VSGVAAVGRQVGYRRGMEQSSDPQSPVFPAEQAEGLPSTAAEPRWSRSAREVTLRRAPRYSAFVVTGVLAGMGLGLLAGFLSSGSSDTSTFALYGYLCAITGLLGGVLGAAVAVLIERRG